MKRSGVLAACLCAAGWLLRIYGIGRQSLWFDEALSVSQAHERVLHLILDLARTDVHPPLYFIALRYWIIVAGDSETAVRLLSASFSTLAIAACYVLTARLTGERAGVLVAALAAVSPLLVYYGQETRMYALLALWSALAGYAFVRADANGRWWPVYIGFQAAALWTQLYGTLLFVALNVWYLGVVVAPRARGDNSLSWRGLTTRLDAYRAWALAQVAVVVLYLPWVPVALSKFQTYTSPGHGSSAAEIIQQTAVVFSLGFPASGLVRLAFPSGVLTLPMPDLAVASPFIAALLIGLVAALFQRRFFLPAWLLLPVIGIIIASAGKRDFNARYLIEAAPAAFVLTGSGIRALWRYRFSRPLGALLSLTLLGAWGLTDARIYADPSYARDDNRAAVSLIATHAVPGAAVALDASYMEPAFQYYARGRWPISDLPTVLPADPTPVKSELARFTAGRPQVWLVLWQDYYSDPHSVVWNWLLQHFYVADWQDFHGGIKVLEFDPLPTVGVQASGATLGGTLRLDGFAVRSNVDASTVDIRLYWRALRRPTLDYRIAAHLFDAAGNDYGNADGPPDDGRLPTTSWRAGDGAVTMSQIRLAPWTAPGNYRVQIVVYDPKTLNSLAADSSSGNQTGLMLPIRISTKGDQPPAAISSVIQSGLPLDAVPVKAAFGTVASLSGYSISRQGRSVTLTLFWQARDHTARPLKVFVHALNAAGAIIATADSAPVTGAALTTAWTPGERIRDPHRLTIPSFAALTALEVGLYDPVSGDRVHIRLSNGALVPNGALRIAMVGASK